jgi:cyclophilin family peptidyl-prolyl cis-trans isomerase
MWHTLLRRVPARSAAWLGVLGLTVAALCPGLSAFAQRAAKGANPRVTLVIEKRGSLTVELFPKAAPKTVAHFLELVHKRFYDGLLFHRLEPGQIAQAGDPKSKHVDGAKIAELSSVEAAQKYELGLGGSGSNVPLEAKMPHERGTLGLARSRETNSGDSQFFFNLQGNHNLDESYCVFGRVVQGLDVMDAIRQGDKIKSIRVETKTRPKR